ncbi:MAG: hypothetical protein SFW08_12715 [Gemmatimonadaceae bacterium]|nr:hypothetical protein [Gemmatimonadaceae bacterium]
MSRCGRALRVVALGVLGAVAPERSAAQSTDATPPRWMFGDFRDDYGNRFTVSDSAFVQLPSGRYRITEWHVAEQFFIAQVESPRSSDRGKWVRIDWMPFSDMAPYRWGFCLTAWDAPSAAAARATPAANRTTPRTGCGGFPFSRMQPDQPSATGNPPPTR